MLRSNQRSLPLLSSHLLRSTLLSILLVGAFAASQAGCSREKKADQSASMMINELMLAAPQDSFVIAAVRFDGPAYSKSLQLSSPEALSVASMAGPNNTATQAMQLAEIIRKSALFPAVDKRGDGLAVGVGFASGTPGKLELGAFGKGTNIDSHVISLVEALRNHGTIVAEESSLKTDPLTFAYSFTVSSTSTTSTNSTNSTSTPAGGDEQGNNAHKFFLLGNNSQISLATSPEAARRPFEKPATTANLLAKDDVKAFFAKMGSDDSSLTYGYADMQAISSAAGQPAATTGVAAIRFSRLVNEAPHDTIGLVLSSNPLQEMVKYLKASPETPLFRDSPAPSVLSIGLGRGVISGLQAQVISETNSSGAPVVPADLQELLGAILSLNVTLDFNPGTSPFPDLIISARSNDAATLKGKIAELIKQGLSSSPFKDLPWESKTVEGSDAQLVRSPMGIGLALAANKESVVLASSENALARGIKVTDGRDSSLLTTLPSGVAGKIERDGSPITYHIDFPRLTALLRGIAPLLGAAAGTQVPLTPEALDNLSKFGVLTGTITSDGNVVEINQTYQLSGN